MIMIAAIKITTLNFTLPGESRFCEKENEKVKKYQGLNRKITRMWNKRTFQVILFVVGL